MNERLRIITIAIVVMEGDISEKENTRPAALFVVARVKDGSNRLNLDKEKTC